MNHLLLAIDDVSLPFRKSVHLQLTAPNVRIEPVLSPSPLNSDAPDSSAAHFYGTVLYDSGKFRMWYYACHWGRNPDWPPKMAQQLAKTPHWFAGECPMYQGPICYAESDDGISWEKPSLGQLLFKGDKNNNAIDIPHAITSAASVIRDDDDPDPARRYKMAYQFFPDQTDPPIAENGGTPTVALAVSPDGLRWSVSSIPFRGQFVEHCSLVKRGGQYMIHYHVMDSWADYLAEGGTACGRTGVVRVSTNWDRWPDLIAETFALAEPEDASLRGMSGPYDQVHMGVGAADFGNISLGVFGLWHNADNTNHFHQISGDLGLLISNDGIHFREPVKGHRFLRRDQSPATAVPGHTMNTVLCQGNGILNVGDETRIYHGRWRNAESHENVDLLQYASAEVALATLPRDRWGALVLNPGVAAGGVCTAPITLSHADLTLNADGPGGLTVDVVDEHFQPIDGFSGGLVGGADGFDCPVSWRGADLSELSGRIVRLWVHMNRLGEISPRLYALNLVECRRAE